MSGENKTTSTQNTEQKAKNQSGPWKPAQRPLKGMLRKASGIEPVDFSGYQPQIQSYIDSTLSGQSNPHLQGMLDTISDQASNTVGSRFAAAGRSFSPSHAQALGKAVTQGLSPYLFQNYQNERAALPGMFNMAAGLPYAGLEAQRNFMLPIAGLGTQGTSNTTGTMTGTQTQTSDPLQTMVGAGMGGLGLLGGTGAFGSGGWLNFAQPPA
jgi:hypothetical protein